MPLDFHRLTFKRREGTPDKAPTTGGNTEIHLDGEKLRSVAAATIVLSARGVAKVTLEMFAKVDLDLNVEADFVDSEEPLRAGQPQVGGTDSLCPPDCIEVRCSGKDDDGAACRWSFWVDKADHRLPDGPFLCDTHCPPEERATREAAMKQALKEDAEEHTDEAQEN